MMTRKHFQAIADAMQEAKPHKTAEYAYPSTRVGWDKAVKSLADMCARQNHRFDRGRFLSACGADE